MKYRLLLLLLLVVEPTLAQDAENVTTALDPVSSSYLFKLTLGLVFIVLLIFGLAWAMKKMQLTQHSNNGLINIVSAISVGHRDRIALIQVGKEQVLVGLTPGRMQTLHTLKQPIEIDDKSSSTQNFKEKFKQIMERDDA